VIRTYRETDEPQINAVLVATWPDDPVLVDMSSLHGPDLDENGLRRRTLVGERGLRVSLEADEANEELWRLIHALPGRLDPELLLFSSHVTTR
jgi:hypothetical protein